MRQLARAEFFSLEGSGAGICPIGETGTREWHGISLGPEQTSALKDRLNFTLEGGHRACLGFGLLA